MHLYQVKFFDETKQGLVSQYGPYSVLAASGNQAIDFARREMAIPSTAFVNLCERDRSNIRLAS